MKNRDLKSLLERSWATVPADETKRTGAITIDSVGTASVVLARLGVCDRDGDLLDPGCLANPGDVVPLSEWNHSVVRERATPAGVAVVREKGNQLVADVVFEDSPEGQDSLARVKAEKPDWSWGYRVEAARDVTPDEEAEGVRRAITKLVVIEVSPVDKGASVGSGTLATCEGDAENCPLPAGPKDCSSCERASCLGPNSPRRQAMAGTLKALEHGALSPAQRLRRATRGYLAFLDRQRGRLP
jgi:hypothetical protein